MSVLIPKTRQINFRVHIGGIEIKRRAWISLVFALASIVLWWLWTGSKIPVTALPPPLPQPALRITKTETGQGDSVLRERAEYFDPTPLFFPTEWNFGQGALPESMKRQPGQIFGPIEPKFIFEDQNIKSSHPETVAVGNLADIVVSGDESPFGGIGEVSEKAVALAPREGFVEIKNLREGKTIVAQILAGIPAEDADFAPLEFLVAVSSAGLVSDPVLMNGSGREEMEVFLRTYLAKTFHVGERLAPGTYRILIGP